MPKAFKPSMDQGLDNYYDQAGEVFLERLNLQSVIVDADYLQLINSPGIPANIQVGDLDNKDVEICVEGQTYSGRVLGYVSPTMVKVSYRAHGKWNFIKLFAAMVKPLKQAEI